MTEFPGFEEALDPESFAPHVNTPLGTSNN